MAIVSPEMLTVTGLSVAKMEKMLKLVVAVADRCTVRELDPGPLTSMLVMYGSADCRLIWPSTVMLRMSLVTGSRLASVIAALREPEPESASDVTAMVERTMRPSSFSKTGAA